MSKKKFLEDFAVSWTGLLLIFICDFIPILSIFILHYKNYANILTVEVDDESTQGRPSFNENVIDS